MAILQKMNILGDLNVTGEVSSDLSAILDVLMPRGTVMTLQGYIKADDFIAEMAQYGQTWQEVPHELPIGSHASGGFSENTGIVPDHTHSLSSHRHSFTHSHPSSSTHNHRIFTGYTRIKYDEDSVNRNTIEQFGVYNSAGTRQDNYGNGNASDGDTNSSGDDNMYTLSKTLYTSSVSPTVGSQALSLGSTGAASNLASCSYVRIIERVF